MHKRFLFLLLLGLTGALLVRTYVIEAVAVVSGSMLPTLYVGQHYLVNKWIYRFRAPQRGEIISFEDPETPEISSIKRVIAIPGDTLALKDKKVVLNGTPLKEPYTHYARPKDKLVGDTMTEVTIPQGHVFVMGDNRDVSLDSTSWVDPKTKQHMYFLPYSKIRGKLILFS